MEDKILLDMMLKETIQKMETNKKLSYQDVYTIIKNLKNNKGITIYNLIKDKMVNPSIKVCDEYVKKYFTIHFSEDCDKLYYFKDYSCFLYEKNIDGVISYNLVWY